MATKPQKCRIVLVGGEKGGTGKTTIAINLAARRARDGRDVLLVDTDKQGSADGWVQMRRTNPKLTKIACVQKFGTGLRHELMDLRERYQDIIVDAGGRDSIELRAAMTCADVMLSPVGPSSFDVWTLTTLGNLVGECRMSNRNLKAYVVMSKASTNPAVTDLEEAVEMVGENKELVLAKAVIRDRQVYRRAAGLGQGVIEYGQSNASNAAAIEEIEQLYQEVYGK